MDPQDTSASVQDARTSITRGQFLGLGAAAAAGIGSVGLAADGRAQVCAARPPYCGQLHNDPPPPPTWTIPASILQVLWGEIYPRMVAQAWLLGSADPFDVHDVTPVLHDRLIKFRNLLFGSINNPSPPQLASFNASRFGRRFNEVCAYLLNTATPLIPIRYHGPGGFDFILSDHGLDLFAPRPPEDEDDLLRYYEYRLTGRPAIALPNYLEVAHTLDVYCPAGPSQVWTDAAGLNMAIDPSGCRLGALTCLDQTEQTYPEVLTGLPDRRVVLRQLGWKGDEATLDYVQQRYVPFASARGYTIQGYFSAVTHLRCWQLEGAVYRGILEQLPRIVATVWRESLGTCIGGSYAARFGDPRLMRQIFEERLETMLPKYDHMVFEVGGRPDQPPLDDVEITNHGLRFPVADRPDITAMLSSIAAGRAGNPVFTDSKRPDGDE